MNIAILYNPKSGQGKAKQLAQNWEQHLKNTEHTLVDCSACQDKQHTLKWSQKHQHLPKIIIGGDGTLHHFAQTLLHYPKQAPILFVAAGTANLLTHTLGLPQDPKQALPFLQQNHVIEFPLGELVHNNQTRLIITNWSFGIDAKLMELMSEQRKGPIHLKDYLPLLKKVLTFNPPPQTIKDKDYTSGFYSNLSIYAQSFFKLRPPQQPSWTGYLRTKEGVIPWLTMVASGVFSHLQQSKAITLDHDYPKSLTGPATPIQADGEFIGYSPIVFKLSSHTLPLVCLEKNKQ